MAYPPIIESQGERMMAFGGEREGEGEGGDEAREVLNEAAVLDTGDEIWVPLPMAGAASGSKQGLKIGYNLTPGIAGTILHL